MYSGKYTCCTQPVLQAKFTVLVSYRLCRVRKTFLILHGIVFALVINPLKTTRAIKTSLNVWTSYDQAVISGWLNFDARVKNDKSHVNMVNIHISAATQINWCLNVNVAIELSNTQKHAHYIFEASSDRQATDPKMCKEEFRLRNFKFWHPVRRDFIDSRVSYVIGVCLTEMCKTSEQLDNIWRLWLSDTRRSVMWQGTRNLVNEDDLS